VLEYIAKLARSRAAEAAGIERYIDLLEDKGERLQFPFASPIDKKERIFELRPGNHRVAYASHGGQYVLLHAWRKQTQKLDEREAATARRRIADWRECYPEPRRSGKRNKR
jgi:phage-related protein